jgi:hypothetical protein
MSKEISYANGISDKPLLGSTLEINLMKFLLNILKEKQSYLFIRILDLPIMN